MCLLCISIIIYKHYAHIKHINIIMVCIMDKENNIKRVNLTVPKVDYDIVVNELVKKGHYVGFNEYIRHLIKEDLKKRNLIK